MKCELADDDNIIEDCNQKVLYLEASTVYEKGAYEENICLRIYFS